MTTTFLPPMTPAEQEAYDWAFTSGIDAEKHPGYLRKFREAVWRAAVAGLTREHVTLLRTVVKNAEGMREIGDSPRMNDDEIEEMTALATCIEALLPPQEGRAA